MPTKVNVVLDDDVKADLDRLVEAGRRSRVVNDALRKEMLAIRRSRAAERLARLRTQAPRMPTTAIVRQLRRDRSRS
jgi:predicted transcriptional regulator